VKSITVVFAVAIFSLCIILPFSLYISPVSAQNSSYSIQRIDHQIEVMYSGHLVIRDTIHVTGQLTDGFLIGFPKIYGAHVLKGIAYDANGVLPISLNVPFEGHSDLYGASISFPQEAPQVFTVIFLLSNDLVHQNNSLNAAVVEFPAYPSLAKETVNCNVTLVLPDFASSITLTKNDGTISTTNFIKQNLAAFTSSPANVTFSIPTGILQLFSVTKLNRVITLNPAGYVVFSDNYRVVNNGNDSLIALGVEIPLDASNIVVKDEIGRNLTFEKVGNNTALAFHYLNVTFVSSLTKAGYTQFTVEYNMPRVPSEQITNFAIDFDLLTYFDYYITNASIIIVPPESATFLTYDSAASLNKDGFQETLTINKAGVSHIDLDIPSEALQITYSYNPLWLSLRPTLWVWLIAAAGCIAVAFWRRPKTSTPPKAAAPKLSKSLSPSNIRAFTDAYEEKNRITSELSLLDVRAQKGKISRRRYKVQKRKLTVRLDSLSKDIAEFKAIFRGAGGNYAGLIRHLDAAETELNEVETNIKNVEARHRKGAISLEEYKKVLANYQRRKEKAETTVNRILLRIREETR
jgi:hypothetical protein